ncbi:hypothetical protein EJB05_14870 [Eragrostis curvula]|uniref:DUF6821 domain-containing protein n=1 Tax=Eragrostis curvula TaxID=38414 RepID=A0A5J9VY38_9POAL|nr:hypothetical protein EJB05_14870 [Eragrostis curvula]
MDRGGVSMDADQDAWDWEVLPDHMSSSMCHDSTNLAGNDDHEAKKPIIMPPSGDAGVHDEPVDECKDIGVVLDETKPSKEESMPEVTDPSSSDGEEEEETFQSPDKFEEEEEEEEEEEANKKDDGGPRRECIVFSVGKLKVNGIGALCSFGVTAATVCIFLIGGKLQQHHHRQQQQKIQLQISVEEDAFCLDLQRIQQVVQRTSRLNQAMSSMMGGGASTRANISFGGFYDGF